MKGSIQVAKGHIEEAAGDLAGSNMLKAKGQQDQAEGRVKQDIEGDVQKVKDSAKKVVDKAKCMAKEMVDKTECMAKKVVDKAESMAKKANAKA